MQFSQGTVCDLVVILALQKLASSAGDARVRELDGGGRDEMNAWVDHMGSTWSASFYP